VDFKFALQIMKMHACLPKLDILTTTGKKRFRFDFFYAIYCIYGRIVADGID